MNQLSDFLHRRFQFSMFRLMVVITLAAILLGLAVTFGGVLELVFSAIACLVPTPLVIFAIFGRRDGQAFAIGALVPWTTLMFLGYPPRSSYFASTIWFLAMGVICGVLAAATRRWLERTRIEL